MKYVAGRNLSLLEPKKLTAAFRALLSVNGAAASGGRRASAFRLLQPGPLSLPGVPIPDTTEPSPSRALDVSAEDEIETSPNLAASQMAQKPCISERSRRWVRGTQLCLYGM